MIGQLGDLQLGPTRIDEDNQSCIKLSLSPDANRRTRHIAIHARCLYDATQNCQISLSYVPTNLQVANALTKAVTRKQFSDFLDALVMVDFGT